jgi:dihydropteroate synthase
MSAAPVIRIVEAGLGPDAQVRLVLSGLEDLDRLHRPWASSGATIERMGERMRATTTVEALTRAVGRTLGKDAAGEMDRILRDAVAAWASPAPAIALPDGASLATDERPLVMGVVNVTPDSFSDGGALYPDGHPESAVAFATQLVEQGADILDVGGESTRPGAEPVEESEEIRRAIPVIEALAGLDVPISIDTSKAKVADAALSAGAAIVNDVSGGADPDLLDVVAGADAAYVLMHTRGTPQEMAKLAEYDDVVAEVYEFLAGGLQRCEAAGIDLQRTIVDPGLGFAKTSAHNLELLAGLRQLRSLGRPVMVGASRKSFLGVVLDTDDPGERLEASLACAVSAVGAGAAIIRAHDIVETARAVRVAAAISTAR